MADAFYTLQEVAAKLNKTEEEVREIIKQGRLREFYGDEKDTSSPLFRVAEVESLMSDTGIVASSREAPDEAEDEIGVDEILLAPESGEEEKPVGSDTTALTSEGINVLGETDEDYKLADDTMGETKVVPDDGLLDDTLGGSKGSAGEASLEEIEEDVNLDTFGSGSGLLDLSLQADDTSLGGILDEIYTPESEGEGTPAPAPEASAMEVAAEAEQLMPDEGPVAAEPSVEAPVMVQGYAEPAPDAASNALGIMLIVPFAAVIYALIVTMADFNNSIPVIRTSIQGLIWYIAIGGGVAAVLVGGAGSMLGGKGGKTTVKKEKKEKKEKKKKEKKPKKEKKKKEKKPKKKKGKKGKGTPKAEAAAEPASETETT